MSELDGKVSGASEVLGFWSEVAGRLEGLLEEEIAESPGFVRGERYRYLKAMTDALRRGDTKSVEATFSWHRDKVRTWPRRFRDIVSEIQGKLEQ